MTRSLNISRKTQRVSCLLLLCAEFLFVTNAYGWGDVPDLLVRDSSSQWNIPRGKTYKSPLAVIAIMNFTIGPGESPLTRGYKNLLLIDEHPEFLQGGPPYLQLKDKEHLFRFDDVQNIRYLWNDSVFAAFYRVWYRLFPLSESAAEQQRYYRVTLTKGTHRLQVVAVDKDGKPYTPMVASAVYNVVIE